MSKKKDKKNQQTIQDQPATETPFLDDKKIKKWHKIIIAVFLLLLIPAGAVFAFEKIFTKRIYPGVRVGDLSLGGKTKSDALSALNQATEKFSEEGLVFTYQNRKAAVFPIVTAADDPDLSRTAFSLENEKTIESAFKLGRDGDFFDNFKNQIKIFLSRPSVKLLHRDDNEEIEKILKETFGYLEKPSLDAELKINAEKEKITIDVSSEESGQIFDYEKAIKNAFLKMEILNSEPTPLEIIPALPKIKKVDTLQAQERAKELAKICSITLGESKKIWNITQEEIRNWLSFQQTHSGISVGLDKEKIQKFLETIAKEINVEPQNAKFQIENGVVKEFQLHQGGKGLNLDASYNAINNHILNFDLSKIASSCPKTLSTKKNDETIELVVNITAPQIPIGSLNNLGIKELVGTGVSDFSGSPVNRRHNIRTGAAKLNGVLIPPGEEFSTNKSLGDISGATGYLPELVIKGDKTIPEYGGGLCQIGTTMFRVALNSGLPVTERRPHSYRVVYYEPAGMDATIYSPKPDLKFVNDTPAYLLLQTKIEGNELTFELWGTSDGRKTEVSDPKIFNIRSPGPTKIIETEDLAPGEKKCTERAHAGADAEFTRTITLANGEVKSETWASHYVAWSAVCLVGKFQETSPENENPSTPQGNDDAPLPQDPALQNSQSNF